MMASGISRKLYIYIFWSHSLSEIFAECFPNLVKVTYFTCLVGCSKFTITNLSNHRVSSTLCHILEPSLWCCKALDFYDTNRFHFETWFYIFSRFFDFTFSLTVHFKASYHHQKRSGESSSIKQCLDGFVLWCNDLSHITRNCTCLIMEMI